MPYQFTNGITPAERQTYLDGLREWELAANVKFEPYTNQARWILFCYNTNFLDYVSGGSYNPQIVTVSSLSRAQVCHEMGHSFGFTHENIRPDATNYIFVLTNNIFNEPSNIYWFTIDPASMTNGTYDYESVMHLGWNFDSTNPAATATQQPKPPNFPRYQYRMGNFCLSPGDRAALAYLYGAPTTPLTNVVTTTADVGLGSLRAALYYVTDHPGSVVKFNIPVTDPGYSNGVYNIHLTGMLPPMVSSGMEIDGSTQPGFAGKPLILVDGSQIIPQAYTFGTSVQIYDTGLLVYSSSNQIKDLSFSGFVWNGLTLEYADATNNTVSGCWIGVDSTGTNPAPNAFQGILAATGASHNTFGNSNVISGNAEYGVFLDSNTVGNVVIGNDIGTDPSGSIAVTNGLSGIFMGNGTFSNTIASNVLSANVGYGIFMTNTAWNTISGNNIGVSAGGETALPNTQSGILMTSGAVSNWIGAHNVISGNEIYGIEMIGVSNNLVFGNYFGTDAKGTNSMGNQQYGVGLVQGSGRNTLGGSMVGAGNVLSGNTGYNVLIEDPGTIGNLVAGNLIGTTAAGTSAMGTNGFGVGIFNGAAANVIGGTTTIAGNVISGNTGYGVYVSDLGTSNNIIEGNLVGTGIAGTNAIPNASFGIGVWSGAAGNVIGGSAAGARNVVSGTVVGSIGFGYGITLGGAISNSVEGNYIGTDISGKSAVPNVGPAVAIYSGAVGNVIGGTNSADGNLIAFNDSYGLIIYDSLSTNDAIRGNLIFSNDGTAIVLSGFPGNHSGYEAGPNDFQNYPVITNAFGYAGSTILQGNFNSLPNNTYYLDFYANAAEGPFGGDGAGQIYLGSVSVATGASGNAFFAYTNNNGNYSGQYITATATAATGDSSQFSPDILATNAPAPVAQFVAPFRWLTNGFVFDLTLATNFSYHIQAATNLAANPVQWVNVTNFAATNASLLFTDRTANAYRVRFYRVVSP